MDDQKDNRRKGGMRITVCDPFLVVDGRQVAVHDFSRTGFEADLPRDYAIVGATGTAELHFQTTRLDNVQDVSFEVVRCAPSGRIAATYTVSDNRSTDRED